MKSEGDENERTTTPTNCQLPEDVDTTTTTTWRRRSETTPLEGRKEGRKEGRSWPPPGRDGHPEAVGGVDGGAGFGADLVGGGGGGGEVEVEAGDEAREGDRCFEGGEGVADALAGAAAEGYVGEVGGDLVRVEAGAEPLGGVEAGPVGQVRVGEGPQEAGGVEGVGVFPVALGAVQRVDVDEEVAGPRQLGGACRRRVVCFDFRERVFVEGAPDEERRLGVHAQRLGDAEARELQGVDVLQRVRDLAVHRRVDLGAEFGKHVGCFRQLEEAPRQRGRRRLVARNQHRHQVVPQLLGRRLLAAGVHEKAQQRRIFHRRVVPLFELLDVGFFAILQRRRNALVQLRVQQVHVPGKAPLPRHDLPRARDLPVRRRRHRAVLCFSERIDRSCHDRRDLVDGVKVVVEHRLPDYV
mmetsp:Transcript_19672/g.60850  ORF Transcript_19672/g.60850 Transcript_19672/m.60850 type:complete len:411 (+) Transcript_19672:144-1376(+)